MTSRIALTWEHMFAPTTANDAAVALLADLATEHVRLAEPPAVEEIQVAGAFALLRAKRGS